MKIPPEAGVRGKSPVRFGHLDWDVGENGNGFTVSGPGVCYQQGRDMDIVRYVPPNILKIDSSPIQLVELLIRKRVLMT